MKDLKCTEYVRMRVARSIIDEPAHTIRYWERMFGIQPMRRRTNERVYTREQVADLLAIKDLLRVWGFTIEGAKKRMQQVWSAR